MAGLSGLINRCVAQAARRFRRAREGSIATMFGLALVPIGVAVGAAMDYSRASDTQVFLAAAADSAALSTVTARAMALSASDAQKLAQAMFDGRAAQTKFASAASGTVLVTDGSKGRTTTVTFTATVPTSLMRLAGWTTVPVGGDAKAFSAPPTYIDFYLLLDNTPSMGLGATLADIAKMESLTTKQPDGKCALACHISGSTTDNYAIAKKNNVTMRIDVVRTATQQLVDTATATAVVPGQYRMALSTFGDACGNSPKLLSPLTSNLSTVKTSANAIDLMTIPYQGYNNDQCSDFNNALTLANAFIPSPGDGTSAASPQKILFLVSDGVTDAYNPGSCTKTTSGGRCIEPINVAYCAAIKARGIKIAVLYTTYFPIPSNGFYMQWIDPFQPTIGSNNMQTCASSGLYFEVTPSQGISDAMTELFRRSILTARLSE